jgi:hypothetical protein
MIVQTLTGKRGLVIGRTPPDTPPESARVFVRLEVVPPGYPPRPITITARYHPSDVIEVRSSDRF